MSDVANILHAFSSCDLIGQNALDIERLKFASFAIYNCQLHVDGACVIVTPKPIDDAMVERAWKSLEEADYDTRWGVPHSVVKAALEAALNAKERT